MSAPRAKLVPFTVGEWKKVQRNFRSNEIKELNDACEILNMWISRMGNGTPVVIDISELILRSLILEKSTNRDASIANTNHALVYGSAIIRFINYVNEICQSENGSLQSIAVAVRKMNIPNWVVSIRHEVTHSLMPSMFIMQEALLFCRNWLWDNYWKRQFNEALKEISKEDYELERFKIQGFVIQKIYNSFLLFAKWRKNVKSDVQEVDLEHNPFYLFVNLINAYPEEYIRQFVKTCLVKSIKCTKMIGDIMRQSWTKKGEMSQVRRLHLDNVLEQFVPIIRRKEQYYYQPIIQLLNSRKMLPFLLLEITYQIANDSLDLDSRYSLGGWANILLKAFLQPGSSRSETNITEQIWKQIIKYVILSPQFYNKEQVFELLEHSKNIMTRSNSKRMNRLLKARLNIPETNEDEDFDPSNYTVQSLRDLQNNINNSMDCTFSSDVVSGENNWSLADPDELGALGLTMEQTVESLNLEIPE